MNKTEYRYLNPQLRANAAAEEYDNLGYFISNCSNASSFHVLRNN